MCRWMTLGWALVSLTLAGCGGSGSESTQATNSNSNVAPPEAVVAQFLEAIRTGQDELAGKLLTPLARQKTIEMELEVAPPGSDTASYKVSEVEYIAEDGAHVASEWTDIGDDGQPHTDPIIWMVRREADGWRIAGMATRVFEDEPPLYLNFEDPEDMLRKQQLVAEEIERRMGGQGSGELEENRATAAPAQTTVR